MRRSRGLRLNRATGVELLGHLADVGSLLGQFEGLRKDEAGRLLEIDEKVWCATMLGDVRSKDQDHDNHRMRDKGADSVAHEASRRHWLRPGSEEIEVAGFDWGR